MSEETKAVDSDAPPRVPGKVRCSDPWGTCAYLHVDVEPGLEVVIEVAVKTWSAYTWNFVAKAVVPDDQIVCVEGLEYKTTYTARAKAVDGEKESIFSPASDYFTTANAADHAVLADRKEKEDLQLRVKVLEKEVTRLRAERMKLARQRTMQAANDPSAALKTKCDDLTLQTGHLQGEIRLLKIELAKEKASAEKASGLDDAKARIADLEKDAEVLRKEYDEQLASLKAELEESRSSKKELEATIITVSKQLEAVQAAHKETGESSATIKERLAKSESELIEARSVAEQLEGKVRDLEAAASGADAEHGEVKKALAETEASAKQALADLERVQADIATMREALDAASSELGTTRAALEAKESECAQLKASGASHAETEADMKEKLEQAIAAQAEASEDAAAAKKDANDIRAQLEGVMSAAASLLAGTDAADADARTIPEHLKTFGAQAAEAKKVAEADVSALNAEKKALEESVAQREAEVGELKTQIQAYERTAGAIRESAAGAESKLEELQKRLAIAESECAALRSEASEAKRVTSDTAEQLTKAQEETASLQSKLSSSERTAATLQETLASLRATSSGKHDELASVAEEAKSQLATARSQVSQMERELEHCRSKIVTLEAKAIEDAQRRGDESERGQQIIGQLRASLEEAQRAATMARDELAGAHEAAEKKAEEAATASKRTAELEAKLEATKEAMASLNVEFTAKVERIDASLGATNEEKRKFEEEAKQAAAHIQELRDGNARLQRKLVENEELNKQIISEMEGARKDADRAVRREREIATRLNELEESMRAESSKKVRELTSRIETMLGAEKLKDEELKKKQALVVECLTEQDRLRSEVEALTKANKSMRAEMKDFEDSKSEEEARKFFAERGVLHVDVYISALKKLKAMMFEHAKILSVLAGVKKDYTNVGDVVQAATDVLG